MRVPHSARAGEVVVGGGELHRPTPPGDGVLVQSSVSCSEYIASHSACLLRAIRKEACETKVDSIQLLND